MKRIRLNFYVVLGMAVMLFGSQSFGQVVINEILDDNRTSDSTQTPDTSEFIELYNAGNSPVDISGWTLNYYLLGTTADGATGPAYFATSDTIPASTTLASHAYYVIGANGVPNVNLPLGANVDLFPDGGGSPTPPGGGTIFELYNGPRATATLIDAVGMETFRNLELANASQTQLNQIAAGQTAGPTATGGWWGQTLTMATDTLNPVPQSLARYVNGRDTNRNGRDFGMLPITPGASNTLPQNSSHTIPNVDALAVGTALTTQYFSSFVVPRVVDPTVIGPVGVGGANVNTKAITASPQGGRAIVAYDETGGGNAVASKELVNKFALYAYIETADMNAGQTAIQSEATTYGIGSTDAFFSTPNQAGLNTLTSTANGNTGIGWMIQRAEAANGGTTTTLLQLIDFNDGGDSLQADNDWQIKATFDLSAVVSGWHILSIDFDPATGNVVGKYDNNTTNFVTSTDLLGTFYVGYRENLPGNGNTIARPPTYDLYVAPAGQLGDFNGDGKVDASDYATWRKNSANASLPNDNGLTTQADRYTLWKANFGKPPGSGSGLGGAAVPEPSTALLAAIGMLFAVAGRRRS